MPVFGERSEKNLSEAHPTLQDLFNRVVRVYDCAVIEGYRGKEEQDRAFDKGHSQLKFPQSKHNRWPAEAVDVVPWFADEPHIRWEDRETMYHFAGVVRGVAIALGYDIRWGGDWDGDYNIHDQTFFDLVHFEIVT